MCGTCSEGYFSKSESECDKCPPGSGGRLAGAAVVLLLVASGLAVAIAVSAARIAGVAAGHGADPNASRVQKAQAAIVAFRMRTIPVSISMVLVSFQVVSILGQANMKWTAESQAVLSSFNVFNIDAQSVAAECSLASFHTMYVLSVLIPLVLLVFVMVGVVVLKRVRGSIPLLADLGVVSTRTLVDSVVFSLAPLLYIPIAKATFVLFDCSRLPNGDFVLDADNGVACFDGKWWSVFPVGLLAFVLYVVGVPVYFGSTIWVRRQSLFESETTARFGSLYRNFRRDYYWGEIANLVKRLGIVTIATFFSRHQLVQIGSLLTIFIASALFVNSRRPYYVPLYNAIDVRLTVVLIAVLLVGAGSYAERTSSSSQTFFFVATIGVVAMLCLVSLHALVTDVLSLKEERSSQFYSASQRQAELVQYISSELKDVEADATLLHAAGEFLATLDMAVRSEGGGRVRSSIRLDDVHDAHTNDAHTNERSE